jgi:hypothetical protein
MREVNTYKGTDIIIKIDIADFFEAEGCTILEKKIGIKNIIKKGNQFFWFFFFFFVMKILA